MSCIYQRPGDYDLEHEGDDEDRARAKERVAHLESHAPWGARVTVTPNDRGDAYEVDATGPAYDAARDAFREAWDGVEPIDMGVGGSIPFIATFSELYPEAPILVTGCGDPKSSIHAPNESQHEGDWKKLMASLVRLFDNLGNDRAYVSVLANAILSY